MKFSNLHQHTVYSDGKNTIEEVVISAIENNMVSIGISDHSFTLHDSSYCMKETDYENYLAEIELVKQKYAGKVDVFKGIELDYYSKINANLFDYIIASVHYLYGNGKYYAIDHSLDIQLDYLNNCCNGDVYVFAKNYYNVLVNHVKNVKPTFVGHFDVITKFGLFDNAGEKYRKIAVNALNEVLKYCNVIEVNTGAIIRRLRSNPYPDVFLLKEILNKGGEVTLSSDSHDKSNIVSFFENSVELLKELGFKYVVQFDGKNFVKQYI